MYMLCMDTNMLFTSKYSYMSGYMLRTASYSGVCGFHEATYTCLPARAYPNRRSSNSVKRWKVKRCYVKLVPMVKWGISHLNRNERLPTTDLVSSANVIFKRVASRKYLSPFVTISRVSTLILTHPYSTVSEGGTTSLHLT